MLRRRWRIALSLAGLLAGGSELKAQNTFNWNNAGGGSYHTAGSWSPAGGPPIFDDFASFNLAGTYGVTFSNNGTQTVDFEVRQGTVTFSYINSTAQHFWGASGVNQVGPRVGDAASTATLNLINMGSNPMSGATLQVGYAAGKTGTLNINTNGRWQGYNDSSVTVGSLGTGNLNITTSGILQNSSLSASNVEFGESGGTGNGLVSGVNAKLIVNNVLTVGIGADSLGTLTISSAGEVNVADSIFIGSGTTKNNTLAVTGTNSTLTLGNDLLRVGNAGGKGTLQIQNGGKVTNSLGSAMVFANDTGTVGNLVVDGAGSLFQSTSTESLVIGQGGTGSASITAGGKLEVARLRLGAQAGATGTMTVDGTNSVVNLTGNDFNEIGATGQGSLVIQNNASLNSAASLAMGFSGSGSMTITSGADVVSNSARLGTSVGGTGQVAITGSGSTWNASSLGNFVLGQSGTGQITIAHGGELTTNTVSFGSLSGGVGSVLIMNAGSLWNLNGAMFVGDAGTGTLTISNGGDVVSNSTINLGFTAGSTGTMNMTDTGSVLTQTGSSFFNVGQSGQGTAIIKNGGMANVVSVRLGVADTGTGLLTVTGLNSQLNTTGHLSLGGSSLLVGGTGTLNINSGGQVNVGTSIYLWGGGQLNLNGGTLHLFPGAFVSNGGQFNWNTGTVNFKQNAVINDAIADVLFNGGDHTLNSGKTLSATGFTVISNTPMILDGGKIVAGGFTNINTMQVKNGAINLTGNLLNDVQGTMILQGTSQVTAPGTLQNNGLWVMQSLGARSTGGLFQNSGIVTGSGQLQHQLQNNATGTVDVNTGERLIVSNGANSSTNQGVFQLLGGRIDFTGQLTNATGGMISGRGVLATSTATPGSLGLTNRGVIAISGGPGDIFGDINNESFGQIITTGGAVTTFHDDVTHNGVEIRTSAGSRTVFLGSWGGAGPFTGTGISHFEGDLRPGNSPANVPFAGDVEFSVTARLVTEVGGLVPGSEYDRITVEGSVMLGGLLDVPLLAGFVPQGGNSFIIIDNAGSDAVLGTFTGLPEGSNFISHGQLWNITYQGGTGNDVMLTAVPEPTTWALLGLTTLGAGAYYWRRRRHQSADQDLCIHE
jgi:T5SS/PEP-CTERM-associated repeat protein